MPKRIVLGAKATCDDGPCGRVTRIVVDPAASTVTHLVVEPEHRSGLGRLVSTSIVQAGTREVSIACSSAQLGDLPQAEETDYLPGGSGHRKLEAYDAYYRPFVGIEDNSDPFIANASGVMVRDIPPDGTIELRRSQMVWAQNGHAGYVEGLVTDEAWRVNFILLSKRSVWVRRVVAVPFNRMCRPLSE